MTIDKAMAILKKDGSNFVANSMIAMKYDSDSTIGSFSFSNKSGLYPFSEYRFRDDGWEEFQTPKYSVGDLVKWMGQYLTILEVHAREKKYKVYGCKEYHESDLTLILTAEELQNRLRRDGGTHENQ